MKTRLSILLALPVLLWLQAPAFAADRAPDPKLDRNIQAQEFLAGIKAYNAGDFQGATRAFEQVTGTGVRNPALFYNLGNAWFKIHATEHAPGSLGRSILWYERARRLTPNDPDLLFNLRQAQEQRKDSIEQEDSPLLKVLLFPRSLLGVRSLQIWALAGNLLLWLGLALWLFSHVNRLKFAGRCGFWLGLPLLLLLLPAALYGLHQMGRSETVVLAEEVPVRSARGDDAPVLFALHEGALVRLEETRDGHVKLRLDQDKVGWAPEEAVAKL